MENPYEQMDGFGGCEIPYSWVDTLIHDYL